MNTTQIRISFEKQVFRDQSEQVAASMLSHGNKRNIKNLMSDISEEMLSIPMVGNLEEQARKLEYLRGQLNILSYLLESDGAARNNFPEHSDQPQVSWPAGV